MTGSPNGRSAIAAGAAAGIVLPLALCQFVASYAGTNMNVAISNIATDLHTNVSGVQTSITLFTLTMAALMIPGSKLTDLWGRKRCFTLGLLVYGAGAVIALLAQGLPLLVVGYSVFEGVGSALMIPPIYIVITVAFLEVTSRARSFGIVSAAAGIGAAAGPLIGGLITTSISWRASFGAQALLVVAIILIARRSTFPEPATSRTGFDVGGAVLSAGALFLIVLGFLQSRTYGWLASRQSFAVFGTVIIQKGGVSPVWIFVGAGLVVLAAFVLYTRHRMRHHREVLVSLDLFKNRTSNLGLTAQNMQWLILQGTFFVASVFLQEVRHLSAVMTGLVLTPATVGILATGGTAGRMSKRMSQKTLTWAGFAVTIVGMLLLLALVRATSNLAVYVPGLLFMGAGVGMMLTSAVNVVQSAFGDAEQGEISGVSRSASNLGSSLGTAIAGSVLASTLVAGDRLFGIAIIVLACFAVVGLIASVLLPSPGGAAHDTLAASSPGAPTGAPIGTVSSSARRRAAPPTRGSVRPRR